MYVLIGSDNDSVTCWNTLCQNDVSYVSLLLNAGVTPLEYVAFNGLHQFRRPFLAAFLVAYGASFSILKNRRTCRQLRGMSLLEQELTRITTDCIILRAIIKTIARLPTLEQLGISLENTAAPRVMPPIDVAANAQWQHGAYLRRCRWYQNIALSPRTLQHHCRVVVRNCLGPFRIRFVSSLPLPVPLQDYLLLEYDEYK